MRKAKYFVNSKGLDLDIEEEFLKDNKKSFEILKAIVFEPFDLSDNHMKEIVGMSLNTYQKWKSHLVVVGLLQVRQLNATTYFLSVGEDAIEIDNEHHENADYLSLVQKAFGVSLIDDPNFEDFDSDNIVISNYELDPELVSDAVELDKKFPMPDECDIL